MSANISDDPDLVRAVLGDRLASWADQVLNDTASGGHTRALAVRARATCNQIRSTTEAERDRLTDLLTSSSVPVAHSSVSDQRHTIRLDVAPDVAPRAAEVLGGAGYRREGSWERGAARSFWRSARSLVLTSTAAQTTVVRLTWRSPHHRGRARTALRRAFAPTPADWQSVDLPSRLWWAYSAIRPCRLLAERVGLRSRDHGLLEPFLATPNDLLEPLFAVADLCRDDVLLDVGCGDGRVVVAAALSRSCRAIGIEQSAELAQRAHDRVIEAGLDEVVSIVHGDAATVPVDGVTVAVMFLPMVVARRLVPEIVGRLPDGARVVLHEQTALPPEMPPPTMSHAVVADRAVTVVHRWDVETPPLGRSTGSPS